MVCDDLRVYLCSVSSYSFRVFVVSGSVSMLFV